MNEDDLPDTDGDVLLPEHVADIAEGVMQVLQVLVLSLSTQGVLDSAHFARLLMDWRTSKTEDGSFAQLMVDRMLNMLVGDSETLIRRAQMRVVPPATDPGDDPPSPPAPDHEG